MKAHMPGRTAGFTLLELLLGLTLVGVAVSMLAGAVHLGGRAWQVSDRHLARLEAVGTAHGAIRRILGQALPGRSLAGSTQSEIPVFLGDAGAMTFVAVAPLAAIPGGPHLVRISFGGAKGAQQLELAVAPFRADAGADMAGPFSKQSVLLEELAAARFGYFGLAAGEPVPRWQDRWGPTSRLPDLVRVAVSLADGTPWPDLIVALPLK